MSPMPTVSAFDVYISGKAIYKGRSGGRPIIFGGHDTDRTCDLPGANRPLSQLSYAPENLVTGAGFEPAMFWL